MIEAPSLILSEAEKAWNFLREFLPTPEIKTRTVDSMQSIIHRRMRSLYSTSSCLICSICSKTMLR